MLATQGALLGLLIYRISPLDALLSHINNIRLERGEFAFAEQKETNCTKSSLLAPKVRQ